MLQGFYWESHRHGYPDKFPAFGQKKWYDIVREQAPIIREGRFDLIWLPPPSYAGTIGAGYNPKSFFKINNSYGRFQQHRSIFTLKDNKGNYDAWYGFGNGIGMVGDTTDGHPWKNRAVTFLENHDTGYRTNEDDRPKSTICSTTS